MGLNGIVKCIHIGTHILKLTLISNEGFSLLETFLSCDTHTDTFQYSFCCHQSTLCSIDSDHRKFHKCPYGYNINRQAEKHERAKSTLKPSTHLYMLACLSVSVYTSKHIWLSVSLPVLGHNFRDIALFKFIAQQFSDFTSSGLHCSICMLTVINADIHIKASLSFAKDAV